MGLYLNATAGDVLITITTPLSSVPTILAEGFGENEILEIDDVEDLEVAMTMDGSIVTSYKPKPIVGKITLQANATGKLKLKEIVDKQKLIRAGYPVTINVTSPSNLYNSTYTNAFFTTKYKGGEFADKFRQVTFTFSAAQVDETALGSVLSLASGIAGIL
jgi:hypothetical protein